MQKPVKKFSICLYSPYVPKHFGGGERYFFSVASYLSRYHSVVVAISGQKKLTKDDQDLIRYAYEKFFSLDLSRIKFISSPIGTKLSYIQKLIWTKQFDVMYAVTDGSLFFSLAKRNVMHIQFPFTHHLTGLINRLKLANWQVKNTNSQFTKKVIQQAWDINIDVVHSPYVDRDIFQPADKKEKIILSVGRFFTQLHSKKQDLMVRAFRKMIDKYPELMKGWKLVLIGGVENEDYANKVAELARDYPIKILHDVSEDVVRQYYAKSKIYWHAAGYGVDEFLEPQKVEHFGITTLEAMASGCIPIVINKGGQKEIVEPGVNGLLWNEVDGLIEKTLACIDGSIDIQVLSQKAEDRAQEFNKENFYSQLNSMIESEQSSLEYSGEVSVVIPNYNGRVLMQKYLKSVIQAMRDGDELIIVDDQSTDDSASWLKQRFSLEFDSSREHMSYDVWQSEGKWFDRKITVTLVLLKKNSRFAAACNTGVSLAEHELIWLLNTDVSPHPSAITELIKYFLVKNIGKLTKDQTEFSSGMVFAVGCHEIEKEANRTKISGGKNVLWFERGLYQHQRAIDFSSGETAWASGGSAMFDKMKWQALGGFDIDYFPAYWEDIDLSFRAKKMGWYVLFEQNSIVDHNHESTNSVAIGVDAMRKISIKNSLLFLWKNGTVWQKFQFFIWLPYHLVVTNKKMDGVFVKGFWDFLQLRK